MPLTYLLGEEGKAVAGEVLSTGTSDEMLARLEPLPALPPSQLLLGVRLPYV